MSKKPRLTLEQHTELGRSLTAIRDELQQFHQQLNDAYPLSGPEAVPGAKLGAAFRAVDEARCALDAALFREHPEGAEATVYYPKQETREAARSGR